MVTLESQVKALQASHTNQIQDIAQLKSELHSSIECMKDELKKGISLLCSKIQNVFAKASPQKSPKDLLVEEKSTDQLDYPSYAHEYLDGEQEGGKNMKFLMSRFNGENIKDWLFTTRRYFLYYKIPRNQKVLIASFHMDGVAQEWVSYMESSNLISDWTTFASDIHKRFDPNDKLIMPLPRVKCLKHLLWLLIKLNMKLKIIRLLV